MKKYFNASMAYLILGLIAGVFYREFTRMAEFTGQTVLKGLHTHILVLGFLFFIIVLLLDKNFGFSKMKGSKAWFISYNVSMVYFIATMVARGVAQVRGIEVSGLSHIAGLAHALFGAALVWFIIIGNKMLKEQAE
ncbi:MAG: DUF2871 domain-containing protein [Candidatus Niameybacter stercoravium]|nr:DUF2871 domain-containing protein [Candidatus Niameybacter stercoravium]